MRATFLFHITVQVLVSSCTDNPNTVYFNAPLFEPCMIVNHEQDNTIEGKYILVDDVNRLDSSIQISFPEDFFIKKSNFQNWVVGWGSNTPLYDAGFENIRVIKDIDFQIGKIYLGNLECGNGWPSINQRIVFWNTSPSGFSHYNITPILDTKIWPGFSGSSIHFSSIEYDSILNKWIMIANECDASRVQIYAASSENLIDWSAEYNGEPILTVDDFERCEWALTNKSENIIQTPYVSDIIRHQNKWYLFFYGVKLGNKRAIGIAVSDSTLLGDYKIFKAPVLIPGKTGSWNSQSVFYPKIMKYKTGFIMFYVGVNSKGTERIGMAFSKDLINWTNSENNPVINHHSGWRSSMYCSEPNYIEIRNDSIFLMVAGMKKFKMGAWHHYITRRMYLDKSGNVNAAQLGFYLSTDGGNTFTAHKWNPVFTNDYSNVYENLHMGGNFELIETDTVD